MGSWFFGGEEVVEGYIEGRQFWKVIALVWVITKHIGNLGVNHDNITNIKANRLLSSASLLWNTS